MPEENGQAKDTTLTAAFLDSVHVATRWNSFVNKIFDPYVPSTPAFDRFAIRFNAATWTPFIWTAKKLGLTPVTIEPTDKTETGPDAQVRSASPTSRTPS